MMPSGTGSRSWRPVVPLSRPLRAGAEACVYGSTASSRRDQAGGRSGTREVTEALLTAIDSESLEIVAGR